MKSADLTSGRRVGFKSGHILLSAGNFVLILASVCCTIGSLVSAFSFTVSIAPLLWVWLASALALVSLSTILRGKGILMVAPIALALIVWKLPEVVDGAKWVLFFITGEYNKWIEVPVLFSGSQPDEYALTVFFAVCGVCLTFLLSIAICLRRSAFLTVIFTAPFVFLTFILTTYQPHSWLLIDLLAVYLTLIISNSLHPDDYHKRGTVIFPALAVSILLLAITYLIAPAERETRSEFINTIDNRLRSIAAQVGFTRYNFGAGWPETTSGEWQFNTHNVLVSDAGPRAITNQNLLEINASRAGTYYLRGYSMQQFDGRAWYATADSHVTNEEYLMRSMPLYITLLYNSVHPEPEPVDAKMTITKVGDHSNLTYLPYYAHSFDYDYAENASYTVAFSSIDYSVPTLYNKLSDDDVYGNLTAIIALTEHASIITHLTYTTIEDKTAESLRRLAIDAGIDPFANREEIADSVARYITASARYTLAPYPIPDGEDFALYFIETSRQGYCIHFATAAALMLRALDIPARFTSGFVVNVPYGSVGETIGVTDRQAHAWVEVYYDDIGWIPLEVTPAGSGLPVGRPHAPTGASVWDGEAYEDYYTDWPLGLDPGLDLNTTIEPETEPEAPAPAESEKKTMALPIVVVCLAALLLALVLRRLIVRRFREKRFRQADTNTAVICIWRYISRLSRKTQPPAEIEDIALKARFSQHRITWDERAAVLDYALKLSSEVYEKYYLPGRLWLKYILLY